MPKESVACHVRLCLGRPWSENLFGAPDPCVVGHEEGPSSVFWTVSSDEPKLCESRHLEGRREEVSVLVMNSLNVEYKKRKRKKNNM